jgi:hypothetical protein
MDSKDNSQKIELIAEVQANSMKTVAILATKEPAFEAAVPPSTPMRRFGGL